jgi:hypothetical protein
LRSMSKTIFIPDFWIFINVVGRATSV